MNVLLHLNDTINQTNKWFKKIKKEEEKEDDRKANREKKEVMA